MFLIHGLGFDVCRASDFPHGTCGISQSAAVLFLRRVRGPKSQQDGRKRSSHEAAVVVVVGVEIRKKNDFKEEGGLSKHTTARTSN
eukprot:scaffold2102_cov161-Amphora_coffeaeformis.AAC.5